MEKNFINCKCGKKVKIKSFNGFTVITCVCFLTVSCSGENAIKQWENS